MPELVNLGAFNLDLNKSVVALRFVYLMMMKGRIVSQKMS